MIKYIEKTWIWDVKNGAVRSWGIHGPINLSVWEGRGAALPEFQRRWVKLNWTSGNGKRIAMLLCLLAVLALLGLSTRGSLQGPEGLPVRGAVEQGEKPGTSGAASSLSVPESGSLPESPAPAGEEPSPEEADPPVEPEPPSSQPDVPAPVSSESQPEVAVPIFTPYGPEEPVEDYVDWLVQRTLAEIQHPGMTEYTLQEDWQRTINRCSQKLAMIWSARRSGGSTARTRTLPSPTWKTAP